MELSISIHTAMALFGAMAVLAAVPSVSVLAVSARAATLGFGHGALTAAGIVLGDLFFVLIAVFGVAFLAEAMGPAFVVVKYAGAAYLLWLSWVIWRSRKVQPRDEDNSGSSAVSSLMLGLLITLGDQKAILFYLGVLSAMMNLSGLTSLDVVLISAITVVAVGGVKIAYAYAAKNAGQKIGGPLSETINILAASTIFMAGIWVVIRG